MRTFIRQPSKLPIEVIAARHTPANKNQLLTNISFGGLCCKADEPIRAGTMVNIRLASADSNIDTRGRVSWCRSNNSGAEIGVQFLTTDSSNQLHMMKQVCDIERYRKRILEREGRILSSEQAGRELQKQIH